MALPIKLLLIEKGDKLGNGLAAIRAREGDLMDISDYESAMSDSTSTANPNYVIVDNKVYRMIKTYFDLENERRIVIAKEDMESYDVIATPDQP